MKMNKKFCNTGKIQKFKKLDKLYLKIILKTILKTKIKLKPQFPKPTQLN